MVWIDAIWNDSHLQARYQRLCFLCQLIGIGRDDTGMFECIKNMPGPRRVKDRALQVDAAGADYTGNIQIFPCVGGDKTRLRQEIGMQNIKRFSLIFFHEKSKPLHECIVYALVRAKRVTVILFEVRVRFSWGATWSVGART